MKKAEKALLWLDLVAGVAYIANFVTGMILNKKKES